jgi:hypothetical protein
MDKFTIYLDFKVFGAPRPTSLWLTYQCGAIPCHSCVLEWHYIQNNYVIKNLPVGWHILSVCMLRSFTQFCNCLIYCISISARSAIFMVRNIRNLKKEVKPILKGLHWSFMRWRDRKYISIALYGGHFDSCTIPPFNFYLKSCV